jgi:hypothetical protein
MKTLSADAGAYRQAFAAFLALRFPLGTRCGQGRRRREAQLDHVIDTKQAAAYDRAKRLEIRRALVAWYERQMLTARDGAKVVPLRKATPSS